MTSRGKPAGSKQGPSYGQQTTTYSPPDPIVIDSNSEPDIIDLVDDDSYSDIEELPNKPGPSRPAPKTTSKSSNRHTDIIDLSMDDAPPLHTTLLPSVREMSPCATKIKTHKKHNSPGQRIGTRTVT